MNKTDLCMVVAKEADIPLAKAKEVVEVLLDAVMQGLVDDTRVNIRDFGNFAVHERKSRTGRNPQNGQPIVIPAKKVVSFRAGQALLSKINKTRK
jgi:nucleoid DNA-binding protein